LYEAGQEETALTHRSDNMTAAQLACLAELAAYAAGFFSTTDPEAARMFGDAARRAEVLSPKLQRDEEHARQRAKMPGDQRELANGLTQG
jgi:hypothetical protein